MIFTPKVKRFSLKLCDDRGIPLKLPRKVKVRYDTINKPASFQFFIGKNPISPIFTQVEDIKGYQVTGTLKSGEKVTFDFETHKIGKSYVEKIENVYVRADGELMFDNMTGKQEPYVLDKKELNKNFEYGFLLRGLVGVKNDAGKCAILDTFSKSLITDFVLDANDYDIAAVLNLKTTSKFDKYLIIETTSDKKEDADKSLRKFIIVGEDGNIVKEINSQKLLWNIDREEKQSDGRTKEFSYAAFLETNEKGESQTKVIKVDVDSGKVIQEMQVPCVADISIQPKKDEFITTQNDELVLITENPADKKSKGAYFISKDGTVETILKNNNYEIEYFGSFKNGRYLEYKSSAEAGKIALNDKAKTVRIKKSEFASLARKISVARGSTSENEETKTVGKTPEQLVNKNPDENGSNGKAEGGFGK